MSNEPDSGEKTPGRVPESGFFSDLATGLKSIEMKGNPELISTTFVGGLKHLPIRHELC